MINKKDECHVKKCIPSIIPITLELLPKIKMCISKPEIHLVNNAICKPFKSKSKKKHHHRYHKKHCHHRKKHYRHRKHKKCKCKKRC